MSKNMSGLTLIVVWMIALLFPVATGTCTVTLVMTTPFSATTDLAFACEAQSGALDAMMQSSLQPISENPERLPSYDLAGTPSFVFHSLRSSSLIVDLDVSPQKLSKPPQVTPVV